MKLRTPLLFFFILITFIHMHAQDWKTIHTFFPGQTMPSIVTLGDSTIIAASALYNNTDLNIKRSDDNGRTWKEQRTGYLQMNFRGIASSDGNDVFVIGNAGALVRNNGTDIWTNIDLNTTNNLRSIYFVNDQLGFIGMDRGVILRTTDGGENWSDIQAQVVGVSSVSNIYFIDESWGFIAGFNYMQVTNDGGLTWSYVDEFTPRPGELFQLQEVQFLNREVGYVCGDVGLMYKTIDGGQTWKEQQTPTTESLQDMKFINEQVGFACGFEGTIIYTVDGGETWLNMTADDTEHFRSIDINTTRGFLTTQRGSILAFDNIPDLVSVQDLPKFDVRVFPNPTNRFIQLETEKEIEHIVIYGLDGCELGVTPVRSNVNLIDLSPYPSGYYMLGVFSTDGGFAMNKVVKE